MPFELIKSETLVQGRAFKIRRDYLKTPDGRETKFEIIEHGGSVVIIPVDSDGNILFVRQYRHAAGEDLLELPAGTRDRSMNLMKIVPRVRSVKRRAWKRANLKKSVNSILLPDIPLNSWEYSSQPI